MKKIDGQLKADSVEVVEVEIKVFPLNSAVAAKYAFSESKTGLRFGSGNASSIWSDSTMTKLSELIASLEADIAGAISVQNPQQPEVETEKPKVEETFDEQLKSL